MPPQRKSGWSATPMSCQRLPQSPSIPTLYCPRRFTQRPAATSTQAFISPFRGSLGLRVKKVYSLLLTPKSSLRLLLVHLQLRSSAWLSLGPREPLAQRYPALQQGGPGSFSLRPRKPGEPPRRASPPMCPSMRGPPCGTDSPHLSSFASRHFAVDSVMLGKVTYPSICKMG